MPDIFLDFPIKVAPARVFEAVSTPAGLSAWWTKKASGRPVEGVEYVLWFGPEYDWRAKVTHCTAPSAFELQITRADPDWDGTRIGFNLTGDETTSVSFYHTGWPKANEHWRISCYCWAMYLRLLRRYLECGDIVPYDERLDA
jgi:uncharacterized protein YndB with AHSA1/START domain